MKPTSLSIDKLARLLTSAGGRAVTANEIAADVAAGAPANPDGSISLVNYVAWLALQLS